MSIAPAITDVARGWREGRVPTKPRTGPASSGWQSYIDSVVDEVPVNRSASLSQRRFGHHNRFIQ